jgi:hypothetical protein
MIGLKLLAVILMGISLLAQGWLWRRTCRGYGDTTALVPLFVITLSMLIGILPGLLWPTNEQVQVAGSVVSIVVTITVMGTVLRRLRRPQS